MGMPWDPQTLPTGPFGSSSWTIMNSFVAGSSTCSGRHQDIEVVGEAGNATDALHRIPAVAPDVALLDARLPDGNGIDVCREIRSMMPRVQCLILTSYDDDEALFAAVMAGASGYLLKQVGGSDVLAGIRIVARVSR